MFLVSYATKNNSEHSAITIEIISTTQIISIITITTNTQLQSIYQESKSPEKPTNPQQVQKNIEANFAW
ncbi:hypothetical protein PF023_10785 [Enterococcus thailandicus]|nr:hypothetical protein [Enterococcus thailandicus]